MVLTSCATSEKVTADTRVFDVDTRAETSVLPTVPFLKLRNRTGIEDAAEYFGDERDTLSAGICELFQMDQGLIRIQRRLVRNAG